MRIRLYLHIILEKRFVGKTTGELSSCTVIPLRLLRHKQDEINDKEPKIIRKTIGSRNTLAKKWKTLKTKKNNLNSKKASLDDLLAPTQKVT